MRTRVGFSAFSFRGALLGLEVARSMNRKTFARLARVALVSMATASGLSANASPPPGLSELEAYKHRLRQLESQAPTPARAAQIRQMQTLLTFMQRSIILSETKQTLESQAAAPQPKPEETRPPSPPARPVPPHERPAIASPPEDPPLKPVPSPPPTSEVLSPPSDPIPPSALAPTAEAPPPSNPVPASESPAASKELREPRWFFEIQGTAALGYRDNLLRSAFSDLDSTLLHGELELHLANTQRDEHRLLFLGRTTRTHFLDAPEVRDEDLVFLLAQSEHRLRGGWWLGWQGAFFSAHQAFDDPDLIDLDDLSAPLRFRQWTLAPRLHWEPDDHHHWTLETGYRGEETKGAELEPQDNQQGFVSLGYTWKPSSAGRLRLNYQYAHLDYDERPARHPDASETGRTLALRQHEWQVHYRHTWSTPRARWRMEPGLRLVLEDDESGGYDDLARLELRTRAELRWNARTEARADLRYGHYVYDHRHVSADDSRKRERAYWAGRLSLEHRLTEHAAWWASYEFRENQGNKSLDDYGVHTLYTGIRLTF